MGKVTYEKCDRDTAKLDGMVLFTLDVDGSAVSSSRVTCQGFTTEAHIDAMVAEFVALMKKHGVKPPSRGK